MVLLQCLSTSYFTSAIDPELAEYNLSDFVLNDAIKAGHRNRVAMPACPLCIQCAFAMHEIGVHPMTRQKVASVFVS